MLDTDLEAHHAAFGIQTRDEQQGVAYPGVFLLDAHGAVVTKRFQENYRVREGGESLLEEAFGIAVPRHGPEESSTTEAVTVRAWLDSPTYRRYERLRLVVEVTVAPGYHVYGKPVPEGFVPLSATVSPQPEVEVGEARWPEPHRLEVEGLDEEFWVYDGTVRGTVPLTFTTPPGTGAKTVQATVSYQACSESLCLRPAQVSFSLPIEPAEVVT